MSSPTFVVAEWWGIAEADPTLVGVVVAAISLLAVTYVLLRLFAPERLDRGRRRERGD